MVDDLSFFLQTPQSKLGFLFFFLFGSDLWDGVGVEMVQEAKLSSKLLFLRSQPKTLSYAASSLLDDFFLFFLYPFLYASKPPKS